MRSLAQSLLLVELMIAVVASVNPLKKVAGGLKREASVNWPPKEPKTEEQILAEQKAKEDGAPVEPMHKIDDLTLGPHSFTTKVGKAVYDTWWNHMPTPLPHHLAPHRIVSDETAFDVQFKPLKVGTGAETSITVHGYRPSEHRDYLPERTKASIENGRASIGAQPHQRTSHIVTVGGQSNILNDWWRGSVRAAYDKQQMLNRGIEPPKQRGRGRAKRVGATPPPQPKKDFDVGFFDHRGGTLVTVRGYDPTQHRHLLPKDVREHMDLLQTKEKIVGPMPTSTYKLGGDARRHRADHMAMLRMHHPSSLSTGEGSSKLTTELDGAGGSEGPRSPSHSPPNVQFEAVRANNPRTRMTFPGFDPVRHQRYLPESVDRALTFTKGRHPSAIVAGNIHQVEFHLRQPNVGRGNEDMDVPRKPPTREERRAERIEAARPWPSGLSDPERAQALIPRTKRKAHSDMETSSGKAAREEAEATSPAADVAATLIRMRSGVIDPKGKGISHSDTYRESSDSVVGSHVPEGEGS